MPQLNADTGGIFVKWWRDNYTLGQVAHSYKFKHRARRWVRCSTRHGKGYLRMGVRK